MRVILPSDVNVAKPVGCSPKAAGFTWPLTAVDFTDTSLQVPTRFGADCASAMPGKLVATSHDTKSQILLIRSSCISEVCFFRRDARLGCEEYTLGQMLDHTAKTFLNREITVAKVHSQYSHGKHSMFSIGYHVTYSLE
jgi:hypothetical protein